MAVINNGVAICPVRDMILVERKIPHNQSPEGTQHGILRNIKIKNDGFSLFISRP